MSEREVIRERKYKAGYVVRDENWVTHFEDKPDGHTMPMKRQAYNLNGEWIGDSRWARRLIVKLGIMPEKSKPEHCVCSIGFCESKQKWYGWSHRAICGFGVGDKVFEEEPCRDVTDKTPFVEHGDVVIENMEQAKQAAVNFAESVS